MFTKILVTLDGSEYSERALAYGSDLAKIAGADVVLLTVVPSVSSPLEATGEDTDRFRKERASAYLDEQADSLREAGIAEVATEMGVGQPATVIAELARELHTDLIVMSTEGLGAEGRYGLGSVALKVLMAAPCPVLMVRINKPEPPRDEAEARWQWEGGANVG